MFTKFLTILFIIPAIIAKIEIEVSLRDENERDVYISGSSVAMIGEKELYAFGLSEQNMKNAIAKTMEKPDNVYLNSPTPWGDLFETMNWAPTKMILTPKKAAILSAKNEQVLVKSKSLQNTDTFKKTQKIDMRQLVRDTVSSKWIKENDMEVEDIHYNFYMKMLDNPFSFVSKGRDFVKTVPVSLGGFINVSLEPQQSFVAELYASAEVMHLRVDYEASLDGTVAMNFNNKHEGHRFWSMDINSLQTAGGFKKTAYSSEIIEVVHFTDAIVVVKDLDTDKVIFETPLSMF